MNWPGPTFTDSGGFQVMSLGAGFKKVISMEVTGEQNDDAIAVGKERLSNVDDDGVTFKSTSTGRCTGSRPRSRCRSSMSSGPTSCSPSTS